MISQDHIPDIESHFYYLNWNFLGFIGTTWDTLAFRRKGIKYIFKKNVKFLIYCEILYLCSVKILSYRGKAESNLLRILMAFISNYRF